VPALSSSLGAQQRRHRVVMRPVFPGQRLMRLEFLHGRMISHASATIPAG